MINNGKWAGRLVAVVAVVAATTLGILALDRVDRRPRTHDGYIFAETAGLAPDVSGRIVKLRIRDNQRVSKGEALVEIDPEPFELRLRQARAQVEALRGQIDLTMRQIASQTSGAGVASTQIGRARAQLELARDTRRRVEPMLGQGTEGSPYYNVNKPGGALFVQFSWPILDGGRRDREVMIAQSEVNAAGDALEQIRNTAAKQVADAYQALTTALAEHDAALTLIEAAHTAHAAALSAYRHGVGTYTSLADEQNALIQAETALEDARATVFTAASALAFATSSLSYALDSR